MVLIANKAVEDYISKKDGVVFKLDFEKAYDHVEGDFLDFVLEEKGLGDRRRQWIRGCFESIKFSIVVMVGQWANFRSMGD